MLDEEIRAIRKIINALEDLSPKGRTRVVHFIIASVEDLSAEPVEINGHGPVVGASAGTGDFPLAPLDNLV